MPASIAAWRRAEGSQGTRRSVFRHNNARAAHRAPSDLDRHMDRKAATRDRSARDQDAFPENRSGTPAHFAAKCFAIGSRGARAPAGAAPTFLQLLATPEAS